MILIDSYVGGIDIKPEGETFITGGGKVERVINYYAKFNTKDRLLEYKHTNKKNIKDLLQIIGLSVPITFDTRVYYDEQGSKEYDNHDRKDNSEKIITMLSTRLNLGFKSLMQLKIQEYELKEVAEVAMAELIAFLARYVKRKHPSTNMRKIKISYSVAKLLDDITIGKSLFTIIAIGDTTELPSNLSEVVLHMLNLVLKTKPKRGSWPVDLDLKQSAYPKLSKDIIKDVEKIRRDVVNSDNSKKNINQLVYAILMVDHALLPHLVEIEQYFADIAYDVQKIHKSLQSFLS